MTDIEFQLDPLKVAIVGFTASKELAPWDDATVDKWICNNLHRFCPPTWSRLYDLHQLSEIQGDKQHVAFLQGAASKNAKNEPYSLGTREVWTFYPQPEWPSARAFPKQEVIEGCGRYMTNSISWMIGHAALEMAERGDEFAARTLAQFEAKTEDKEYHQLAAPGLLRALKTEYFGHCELHVYGVDMATGGEYASQRPSCEHMLGFVQGMGVQVRVPESSDLLKLTALYGAEDDSALAAKVKERETELATRIQTLDQQLGQIQTARAQAQGALETTRYFGDVWTNPRTKSRHEEPPSNNGQLPATASAKVLERV